VNLLDVPSSLDFAVMGTVILAGAIADEVVRRGRNRSPGRGERITSLRGRR